MPTRVPCRSATCKTTPSGSSARPRTNTAGSSSSWTAWAESIMIVPLAPSCGQEGEAVRASTRMTMGAGFDRYLMATPRATQFWSRRGPSQTVMLTLSSAGLALKGEEPERSRQR